MRECWPNREKWFLTAVAAPVSKVVMERTALAAHRVKKRKINLGQPHTRIERTRALAERERERTWTIFKSWEIKKTAYDRHIFLIFFFLNENFLTRDEWPVFYFHPPFPLPFGFCAPVPRFLTSENKYKSFRLSHSLVCVYLTVFRRQWASRRAGDNERL